MLPNIFKPHYEYELLRIGSKYDGGYLVERSSIDHSECLISFGISTNWDFERIFLSFNRVELFAFDGSIDKEFWENQRLAALRKLKSLSINKFIKYYFIKKNFYKFFNKDNYIPKFISNTLENSIPFNKALNYTTKKNIFLKIDIEGSEYEILDEILLNQSKIIGMVIEFHSCNTNLEKIVNFIENFKLKLVHIHANNYDDFYKIAIPETIEITFSKNPIKLGSYKDLPHKLDRPNKHNKKEIPLNFND